MQYLESKRAAILRRGCMLVVVSRSVSGLLPFQPAATCRASFLRRSSRSSISSIRSGRSWPVFGSRRYDDEDEDEDEEESIDLSGQDWRAFRAKLVMQPDAEGEGEVESEAEVSSAAAGLEQYPDDVDGIGKAVSAQQHQYNILQADASSRWAYDSGNVIERGAVILGGVEQEFGFGLRQQYFHKAAILVLDHQESKFTKGIILNRPSDRMLVDPDRPHQKWRVWFGGDVQFLDSLVPDIVCLHSLTDTMASQVSETVMNDIKWTTFDNAKMLVQTTSARPSDFWVFCGYAGWAPGQLMEELERKSWYMVATDSQTLLQELARQAATADPRDAGLDTWDLLMQMIGRGHTAKESSRGTTRPGAVMDEHDEEQLAGGAFEGEQGWSFDDCMLKEWARKNLLSDHIATSNNNKVQNTSDGGIGRITSASTSSSPPPTAASTKELRSLNPVDKLIRRATGYAKGQDVTVGSLVRASSADRSPFLLSHQEFHKSIVLVLSDDDDITTGVMLNHPAAMGLDLSIVETKTRKKKVVTIPLRFGGEYKVKGAKQDLLWLHCNKKLRAANVGKELGASGGGIWSCTAEQATAAIAQGLASPNDFMVVSGVSVWTKGEKGTARGMAGEVIKGNFELVPNANVGLVWETLMSQELLSPTNLRKTLAIAHEAWVSADPYKKKNTSTSSPIGGALSQMEGTEDENDEDNTATASSSPLIGGLGEGYDEEDDTLVFKSDVKVATLSDHALRSWVATFLLGVPTSN